MLHLKYSGRQRQSTWWPYPEWTSPLTEKLKQWLIRTDYSEQSVPGTLSSLLYNIFIICSGADNRSWIHLRGAFPSRGWSDRSLQKGTFWAQLPGPPSHSPTGLQSAASQATNTHRVLCKQVQAGQRQLQWDGSEGSRKHRQKTCISSLQNTAANCPQRRPCVGRAPSGRFRCLRGSRPRYFPSQACEWGVKPAGKNPNHSSAGCKSITQIQRHWTHMSKS